MMSIVSALIPFGIIILALIVVTTVLFRRENKNRNKNYSNDCLIEMIRSNAVSGNYYPPVMSIVERTKNVKIESDFHDYFSSK